MGSNFTDLINGTGVNSENSESIPPPPLHFIPDLAEALAQMLRMVGSGLKLSKQRLKYGCHNSFSNSTFEMVVNKVQVYKTPPK